MGIFSGAKAKPESVMYYNKRYSQDVPDQMRGRTLSKAVQKMAGGGLLSPEESPAAAGRGAEGYTAAMVTSCSSVI